MSVSKGRNAGADSLILGNMPHFRMLPEVELDRLARLADPQVLARGDFLAKQAETVFGRIKHQL